MSIPNAKEMDVMQYYLSTELVTVLIYHCKNTFRSTCRNVFMKPCYFSGGQPVEEQLVEL